MNNFERHYYRNQLHRPYPRKKRPLIQLLDNSLWIIFIIIIAIGLYLLWRDLPMAGAY